MNSIAMIFATWFGAGYFPVASGTLATFLALPLVWLLAWVCGRAGVAPGWYWPNLALAVAAFWPSVWAAGRAEDLLCERDSHKIVIDEVAGTFLTLAFLPAAAFSRLGPYVWAFFVFRILDVWKPYPIRQSQVLPRGWGIMIDDVLAGLEGGLLLALIWKFAPGWINF